MPKLLVCGVDEAGRGPIAGPVYAAAVILDPARRVNGLADAEVRTLHERFPQYGFDQHKGYSTPEHLDLLRRHGPCEIHRRSFDPVRIFFERDLFSES